MTLIGVGFVGPLDAACAGNPGHESLLPGRVLGCVTIHDATQAADELSEFVTSHFEDECRPFLESLKNNRATISEELHDEVGITLDELRELEPGQVTIASVKVRDEPVSMVLLVDFRSHELINRVVERFGKALDATEFSRTESTIGETHVSVFQRASPPRELVVGIRDSVLCMSTSLSTFTELMNGWNAASRSLPSLSTYQSIVDNCHSEGRKPLFTWFADPLGFFVESAKLEEEDTGLRRFLFELSSRAGLDQFKAIGGSFDVNADEFTTIGRMQLVMGLQTSGILSMFHLQSGERPQSKILSSAASFYSFNWDLRKLYEGSSRILEIIQGPGTLDAYISRIRTVSNGFDPKADLLDKLTGRVHLVKTVHDGEQHRLIALQVGDPKAIGELLDQTTRVRFEFAVERTIARNFGDLMVYEQPWGDTSFFIAILDDMLWFSANEDVLARLGTTGVTGRAGDSKEFQRVSRFLPQKCVAHSFDARSSLLKHPWESMRARNPSDSMGIDFSLLPAFDTLQPQLGPSAGYGVENKDGVLFSHFTLKR